MHRAHDLLHRQRLDLGAENGGRGIGPHAAGVGAAVAITDALVVLRGADRQDVCAVTQHEQRCFLALHEFLDHHFRARAAKGPAKHIVHRCQRFGLAHRDNHTLACGQPVGLDHNRRTLRLDIGACRFRIGKVGISGGWRACRITNLFGKRLGGFQLRGLSGRAEHQNAGIAQPVGHTGGQRGLGADNHEIDGVFFGKNHNRTAVQNIQRRAIRDLRDPCISRRHDQLVAFGVLHHRPGQRVFPPAASKDQNIHAGSPLGLAVVAF